MFVGLVLTACGSAPALKPKAAPPPAVAEPEPPPKAGITRSDVDRALKGGLGRFLGFVDLEAALDPKGKFVGWRVVELRGPKGAWDGVDLRVGDVVTLVNGFKIERDYEADRAFKSLAVASEIRVSLLRDGKPIELRLAIVDDASDSPGSTATTLPPPKNGNDDAD